MLPPRFLKPKSNPCIIQSIFNLCSQGRLSQAVDSLDLLASKGLRLDSQTLAFLLQQCSNSRSLREGKLVHLHLNLTGRKKPNTLLSNHLIKFYCECGQHVEARSVFDKMSARSLYSWNTMLSGYAKSGMIIPARRLFDKMPERDVVSWNTMVVAYAQSGCCYEALMFYLDFRRLGIGFSEYSFAGVFMVCVKLRELGLTRQLHGQVLVSGYFQNVVLSSSAVDAYAKCGEMSDARKMFDEMGMMDVLAWTTLVSGYAMWGDMQAARELFDAMPEKNPVSWTALISGYARHGMGNKALDVFSKMILSQIRPDQFTFSSCLCACASIASLKLGKQIHAYLIRTGFRPNTIVVSSLIDMYSKCGSLGDGRHVFDNTANKQNCVLWNTMLSALAQHGYGEAATKMYDDMVRLGVKPDRITFVVILNACSHSGLTEEGLACFRSMTCDHGIVPDQEHYACLTDLLGRAGRFDELMNQLEKMPCKAGSLVWNALLGVCRIHGNLELGRKAAEKLIELEPESSAAYVFLASIYSAHGSWESVEKLRHLMNKRHIKKERAISWVETGNKHHAFTVSDRSHPSNEEICSILELLAGQMEVDAKLLDT